MHEELYELKEKLMDELKEYGTKDEMTAGTLEVVDKLAHTIKNLCKIIEDSEYSEASGYGSYEGGSMRGGSYEGGSYEGGGSMRGGSYARGGQGGRGGSYAMARGRGRNARRDSMGRYSSDSAMIVDQLRDLMDEAPDMKTRQEIERLVKKMERV